MVPAGKTSPVRLEQPAKGQVLSDGKDMFEWSCDDLALYSLSRTDRGFERGKRMCRLPCWRCCVAIAPAGLTQGLARTVRFAALDPQAARVLGWSADGTELGPVVDVSRYDWGNQTTGIAFDAESGDLLVSTRWEVRRVFRFGLGGREVCVDGHWPSRTFAQNLTAERGRTWALSGNASSLGTVGARGVSSFGDFSDVVQGIAWGGEGYWLATSQGAQYFPAADPVRCLRRIGGLTGVTSLAIARGRVLVAAGPRLIVLWLDDLPDERFSSGKYETFANRWNGNVTAIDVEGATFILHDSNSGENWVFDPEVTQWFSRARRMFKTSRPVSSVATEARLGSGKAVAGPDAITIFSKSGKALGTIPVKATALASSGRWLLAYVPEACAIYKYKIK